MFGILAGILIIVLAIVGQVTEKIGVKYESI